MKKQKGKIKFDELIIHIKKSIYDFYDSRDIQTIDLVELLSVFGYMISETIVEIAGTYEERKKEAELMCSYLMRAIDKMSEQEKNKH